MKRRLSGGAALACAALLLALTACGGAPADPAADIRAAYEEGFVAGLEAGQATAAPETPAPEEAPPQAAPTDPALDSSGFVELAEAAPDVILELRYYSTYNFVGTRIDGYEEPVALLTREAADALAGAAEDLAEQGYRLKVYDAYRPQRAVEHFKTWAADLDDAGMKPFFYPEVEKARLFELGYVASRSGHSRGSTVDVTLFDMAAGTDADMGGSFDYFGPRSHTDYTGLTEAQAACRQLLRDAMEAHGFRGLRTEWWHFSLTDEPYPETYFDFPVAGLD